MQCLTWIGHVVSMWMRLMAGSVLPSLSVRTRTARDAGDARASALEGQHHCWTFESGEPVEVLGRPGVYDAPTDPDGQGVCWRMDSRTLVVIRESNLGLSRADLMRIAESVRPDPGWTSFPLAVPFHVGLYGAHPSPIVTGSSPTKWTARVSWTPVERSHPQHVGISAGPGLPVPSGGQPLTVKGRPARFIQEADENSKTAYLVVDLGGDRRLLIEAWTAFMYGKRPPSREDVVRIAGKCRLDPSPLPWIGARGLTR
jgi:hypothetical protein